MTISLHILTRPDDPLPRKIIERQRAQQLPEAVEVFDLTVPAPDYSALLQKLFAADSVAVW
jgi:hypothetical protein